MKKVMLLLFSICLILCGCSEKIEESALEIPFQKIAACNIRTKLFEKHNYISERTALRPIGDDTYSYWVLYYEKDNDFINAIVDSVDYKCYYYNNQIFADYGDNNLRIVLPYRKKYDSVMSSLLTRTDTLSYVFILNSEAKETDYGYEVSYEFIVNNDILPEFEDLGVKVGDRMNVVYEIDKDYIILKSKYRKVVDDKKIEVARVDITYDERKPFPDAVKSMDSSEKVEVKIIENFGTGSEYSEKFSVPKDGYISENEVLLKYYLFKDPLYENYFDALIEPVTKNTDIFIIDSAYADVLAAREEYKKEQEEMAKQAAEEYIENAQESE